MPLNPFFDGLDNVLSAGKFFVDLTQRLGDGELHAGEDVTRLARTLGMAIPSELAGASILSLGKGKVAERGTEPSAERTPALIVIHYPPVSNPCPGQIEDPGSGQAEKRFQKCFSICKTVGGAKVCAEICIDISISLSGISGSIKATVSVSF
jgi:hypothetical protein